jgi:subtilisin family serine protease
VGAIDKDDSIASYSNFGSCVSIYAPGTSITSIWYNHKTSVHTLSGTSMAAPHVAGVMALLLSEQDYSPSELIAKIKESATGLHGSKTNVTNIVDNISQLIGVEYEDTDITKLLYMDWSSDSFTKSNIPSTSSTSTMRLLIPSIIQLALPFIFASFFILC